MSPGRQIDVLLMTQQLGPGGTERQLTELARHLDSSRYRVHVAYFVEGSRVEELRRAGVHLLRLPIRSFLSMEAVCQAVHLRRYMRQHRIQVAHAFDYPLACFGVPVARWAGVPVVLSSQRGHRALNPPLYQRLQRLSDRLVDGVVVNCEAMREHMEQEGVRRQRIHLCYNGIDTSRFHPPETHRQGNSVTIGAVSVLRPEKGLDTLVRAFALLARERQDLRLRLVGGGPMEPQLAQLASELGVADRCTLEGATNEVTCRLHGMDIFVLPSLSEAFSNSLMEAMACGCAVVASRVGGNPELVQEGETGFLFEAGDVEGLAGVLRRLSGDPDLRCRLGAAASRRMREQFSIEAGARRLEQLYDALLNPRGRS